MLLMLGSFAAHGQQLLKCVSQDGRVEYAAQCPPDTKEMQTGIRSSQGSSGATPPSPQQKSLAEREAEFRKRQMEKEDTRQKDEKKAAEAREKLAACEQAQTYLKSLEVGNRISRVDPKTGERVYLEDADRAAEMAKAQRAVDSWCR